jgi:hypothetical protein
MGFGFGGGSGSGISPSDVKDDLTSTETDKPLSANQGKELKALVDARIKRADIKDNLTSTDTDQPLSANKGKVLKDLISAQNTLEAVDKFSDLPDATAYTDKFRVVKETTGVIGFRKLSGLYVSNGSVWRRLSRNQLKAYDSDLLDGLNGSAYTKVSDVKDILTSFVVDKPLSANQGRKLKNLIDKLSWNDIAVGGKYVSDSIVGGNTVVVLTLKGKTYYRQIVDSPYADKIFDDVDLKKLIAERG